MQYKIIVDKQPSTNPSVEKREYIIDIEELRYKNGVYDSLIITKDEDYVMRRLNLSEYHVLTILDEPVKEVIEDVNIELFEGDNYIYISDMTGNKFYAEYLVKNDFTDLYVTKNQMHSAITHQANLIEFNVNQKLEGYSTTEEMNALIQILANEFNAKVEKKIDGETITGAYLILKVNEDTSEAKLNADKIELSANDVLNILAGNTIDITTKNILINSKYLKINKDGTMTFSDTDGNGYTCIEMFGHDTSYYNYIGPNVIGLNGPNADIKFDAGGAAAGAYIRAAASDSGNERDATVIFNGQINTVKVTQTSLAEYKKNFEELENALDIIKDIDIYKYNFKNEADGSKKHIGFVIGDKYKYSKDVTSEENDGVDTYSFVSVCCKAIQEQQAIIEKNNSEITELKNRIERLEELVNGRT